MAGAGGCVTDPEQGSRYIEHLRSRSACSACGSSEGSLNQSMKGAPSHAPPSPMLYPSGGAGEVELEDLSIL